MDSFTATAPAPPAPRPATPPGPPGPRPPAAAPDWWRTASALAAWFGLAVVVGLWLSGGGLSGVSGTGVAMTSAGRLAGLLASALMLIQVLLMARLPFLERSYGQDELARLHRLVGFTSFNLLLAHVVLVLIGYAQTARRGVLAETWDVLTTYPGMLLAVAGFAALVMVVVTSLRAARRRLRYESWHLLHLYAYLGAGLAVPHQLWTGQDFVTSPLARAYWWTIWLGTLAAVLVYRVGLPLARSLRHQLVVDRVVAESPDVVSVYVSGRRLDRLPARAGQFFQWRFLDGAGWSAAVRSSLSAAGTGVWLRRSGRDVDGSGRLASLRPGTRVLVEGPYGRLTAERRTRRKVTMLAAGIGITPLRAVLDELDLEPGDATVVYRASDDASLVLRDELAELSRARGVRLVWVVGPRARGRDSWLPQSAAHLSDAEALRHVVPDIAEHDVYLCGADGWMRAARAAVLDAGVPASHVHSERFSW
jgi:predicted ferric reductase